MYWCLEDNCTQQKLALNHLLHMTPHHTDQFCRWKRLNSEIFVESKLAADQKRAYDKSSTQWSFKVRDPVWLSKPTAGKLDLKWEGDWTVVEVKGPGVNVKISDGKGTRIIHVNRLQHCILPSSSTSSPQTFSWPVPHSWNPLIHKWSILSN